MMFGVESKWIETLCPVAFSNSGASWLSEAVIEAAAHHLELGGLDHTLILQDASGSPL